MKEYVPSLTARRKKYNKTESLAVGDIVIITDDLNPRGQWPLERITEVVTNSGGIT